MWDIKISGNQQQAAHHGSHGYHQQQQNLQQEIENQQQIESLLMNMIKFIFYYSPEKLSSNEKNEISNLIEKYQRNQLYSGQSDKSSIQESLTPSSSDIMGQSKSNRDDKSPKPTTSANESKFKFPNKIFTQPLQFYDEFFNEKNIYSFCNNINDLFLFPTNSPSFSSLKLGKPSGKDMHVSINSSQSSTRDHFHHPTSNSTPSSSSSSFTSSSPSSTVLSDLIIQLDKISYSNCNYNELFDTLLLASKKNNVSLSLFPSFHCFPFHQLLLLPSPLTPFSPKANYIVIVSLLPFSFSHYMRKLDYKNDRFFFG